MLIDSVFIMGKNYYPQVFLDEYKYTVKEKKISQYINDDLEISSDDSYKEASYESDKECSDKSEKLRVKK